MTDAIEILAQALSDSRNNPPTGPAFSVLDEPVRDRYRAKARALLPLLVADAVDAEREQIIGLICDSDADLKVRKALVAVIRARGGEG